MSNRLTIQVYGTKYAISTDEDPAYVKGLSRELDIMLSGLMRRGGISLNQALVLMCLQYLDAGKKSEQTADHLRGQVAEYLEDARTARTELAAALQKLAKQEQGKGGK